MTSISDVGVQKKFKIVFSADVFYLTYILLYFIYFLFDITEVTVYTQRDIST
jgi:hypothetical protein